MKRDDVMLVSDGYSARARMNQWERIEADHQREMLRIDRDYWKGVADIEKRHGERMSRMVTWAFPLGYLTGALIIVFSLWQGGAFYLEPVAAQSMFAWLEPGREVSQ